MIKTVLLDLDGTIINSEPGIVACVQYALAAFGMTEPKTDRLRRFIGPPLRQSFQKYYGMTPEQADEAVKKYRERYEPTGIFECSVYPGVEKFLAGLRAGGYRTALASSKPEHMCKKLLGHFQLDGYFDEIVGATPDGRIDTKREVLLETFRRLAPLSLDEAVLIGDTCFDAAGGKSVGIPVLGVTYGFGTREEMEREGALVFDTLDEIAQYLEENHIEQ